MEKEDQCQKLEAEVSIRKGKLIEKEKHLKFHDSTKILDNLLNSKISPSIKLDLGFHETVKGEYNSQAHSEVKKYNSENTGKELRSQPSQQPKKNISQRKTFPPININNNRFSPLINDIECFICHNYGHIVANYRC